MLKTVTPQLILLSAIVVRVAVFGASIGDALAIAALCGLHGFAMFLKSKQQPDINSELKKEIADMRSSVNALKIGRTFGK